MWTNDVISFYVQKHKLSQFQLTWIEIKHPQTQIESFRGEILREKKILETSALKVVLDLQNNKKHVFHYWIYLTIEQFSANLKFARYYYF